MDNDLLKFQLLDKLLSFWKIQTVDLLFFSVADPGVVTLESGLLRLGDLDPLDKDLAGVVDKGLGVLFAFLGDLLFPLLDWSWFKTFIYVQNFLVHMNKKLIAY